MLLILHIVIALGSIVWTGFAFFAPSIRKLNVSYALIAGTLATGTYLVVATYSPLLPSCIAGLAYLTVVLLQTFAVRTRLAKNRS